MPSYPSSVWSHDQDAWEFLESRGYKNYKWVIYPAPGHVETKEESHAINYLCGEWDWSYSDTDPRLSGFGG